MNRRWRGSKRMSPRARERVRIMQIKWNYFPRFVAWKAGLKNGSEMMENFSVDDHAYTELTPFRRLSLLLDGSVTLRDIEICRIKLILDKDFNCNIFLKLILYNLIIRRRLSLLRDKLVILFRSIAISKEYILKLIL